MTKQQHRRSTAATLFLAFASGLLTAQFISLVRIMAETGTGVPGRDFLLGLTVIAGFGAVLGLAVTARSTQRLFTVRPLTA